MVRIFLNSQLADPQNIVITDKEIIHKLTKVLRKKVGDTFILFDLEGNEYEVRIKEIAKRQIQCSYLNKSFIERELSAEINLYQALLKKDKFEWLCQKAAEIGVKKIIPIITEYSVLQDLNLNKAERYKKIILEATIQSGGKIITTFEPAIKYEAAIKGLASRSLNLIAHEQEETNQLISLNGRNERVVNLFIGPEGGFSQFEIDLARQNSVIPVSLGKRILRAETAAIVACGIIANNF